MIANTKSGRWCRLLLLLFTCLPAGVGCSVGTGSMLTFFPQREQLTKDAKNIRAATGSQGVLPVHRELSKSVLPAYIVEPGDGLLIQPADLDSEVYLMPDQTVLADGTIHLGKYGQVVVAGKSVMEIQALVRARINSHHQKDMGTIVVRVIVPDSKVYYVLGEVNTPGVFTLKGRETVLDGIVAAGGLNSRASHNAIILSRPTPPESCRVVLPICYDQIVQLGDTTTNYQLKPGDRIYVASRTFLEDLFPHYHKAGLCQGPQMPCLGTNCGSVGEPLPADHSLSSPPLILSPNSQSHQMGGTPLPTPRVEQ